MMRKLMMRAGAVALLTLGLWLTAPPALAAWSACITDGGYQPPTTWGTCSYTTTRNSDGSTTYRATGQCGGRQVPKGYYCADGGNNTRCNARPPRDVNIERYDGTCQVYANVEGRGTGAANEMTIYPGLSATISASCTPGAWYPSSETASIGQCETVSSP